MRPCRLRPLAGVNHGKGYFGGDLLWVSVDACSLLWKAICPRRPENSLSPIAKEGCGTLTESQQRRNRPVAVSPLGLRRWSSLFRRWSELIFLQPALRAQHLVVHEPSAPHLAAGQVALRLAPGWLFLVGPEACPPLVGRWRPRSRRR